jgi:succinate dehydrogenase / fumarate reductase, cytochrome b subunit
MNIIQRFFRSTLGKKYIMAVTGVMLFLFVITHLIGNLQIFLGPDTINEYGRFLHTKPAMVWAARLGLLGLVALHIWSAVTLAARNRAARASSYGSYQVVASSYASRTMLMSGLIVLAFIVYHLLHFTVQAQAINLTGQDFSTFQDSLGRHDIHRMMVVGFSNVWVSGFYVLGVGLLCLHLSHGVSSMFQSLGLRNRAYSKMIDGMALGMAIFLFLGYISIPVAVLTGLVK